VIIKRFVAPLSVIVIMSGVRSAEAQQVMQGPRQAVSANPFGLLFELFNAEYERSVSKVSTAGGGGSFFSNDGDDYVNADVFYRFYPSGHPLEGFAVGVKAGITNLDGANRFGFGFDTNWSWLLGTNDRFYVGLGFGLKRLYGGDDRFDIKFIPTVRLINLGVAF
jgi:hypothetical protein